MFEYKLENTYEIEIHNGMTCIHDNKVNNIAEFNPLHDIINPSKCTKNEIAITILFYMYVCIKERVNKHLRTFESYWAFYVVPILNRKASLKNTS